MLHLTVAGKHRLRRIVAEARSSVCSVSELRTGGRWFDPRLGQYSFLRIDDTNSDRINSSLIAFHYFGYLGKQPITWKEYQYAG